MSGPTIDEIRARHAAARPGPWRWRGNLDNKSFRLQSIASGRWTVMDFRRFGMSEAQPVFCNHDTGFLVPGQEMVIFEVCPECTSSLDKRLYRKDFIAISHPDAQFIAHSWEDVDVLLKRIAELEAGMTPS